MPMKCPCGEGRLMVFDKTSTYDAYIRRRRRCERCGHRVTSFEVIVPEGDKTIIDRTRRFVKVSHE